MWLFFKKTRDKLYFLRYNKHGDFMKRPFTADSMWTYYNGTLKNKFEIKDYKKMFVKINE